MLKIKLIKLIKPLTIFRIKFQILLGLIVFSNLSFSQPIYTIQKGERILGILAGSVHQNEIQHDLQVEKNLINAVNKSDSLYIEWSGGLKSPAENAKLEMQGGKKSMRELIAEKKPSCLSWLATTLDNKSFTSSSLLDTSPMGFFVRGVVPVSAIIRTNPKVGSLDHIMQFQAIKTGKKITEIETGSASYGNLLNLEDQQFFNASENACIKFHRTSFFNDQRNITNMDFVFELYGLADINQLRDIIIESYRKVGWPEQAIAAYFDYREEKFVEYVERVISSGSNIKPMFIFGASHLGGNAGVIALLKKRGFKVLPLKPDDK